MREMEFRFDFLISSFIYVLWWVANIYALKLIFRQVKAIGGWSENEVMLLFCVYFFANSIYKCFVRPGTDLLAESIRDGKLDFILTKPVPARFFLSFRYIDVTLLTRAVLNIPLLFYVASELGIELISLKGVIAFSLFVLGMFCLANVYFIFAISTFWFIRLYNLRRLLDEIFYLSQYPVQLFKGFTGVLTFVIPVAFLSTFPTQALLGKLELKYVLIAPFLAVVTFVLSQIFWRIGVRSYASASS